MCMTRPVQMNQLSVCRCSSAYIEIKPEVEYIYTITVVITSIIALLNKTSYIQFCLKVSKYYLLLVLLLIIIITYIHTFTISNNSMHKNLKC